MNLVNKSFVYYKYLSYLRSNEFLFVFRNNYDNSKYGVQEMLLINNCIYNTKVRESCPILALEM